MEYSGWAALPVVVQRPEGRVGRQPCAATQPTIRPVTYRKTVNMTDVLARFVLAVRIGGVKVIKAQRIRHTLVVSVGNSLVASTSGRKPGLAAC